MEAGDYARVQRILDEGELFRGRGPRAVIAFLEVDEQLWRAVIKTTADRSETYLVSLHRAKPEDLRAARGRLDRIGGESE